MAVSLYHPGFSGMINVRIVQGGSMQSFILDHILNQVEKPSRYTGGELNSITSPFSNDTFNFAFCFPDLYEVAMSHLGMKILYGILNEQTGVRCERVCMPWVDMRKALQENNVELFSLESKTPLYKFDVVGFTLQYEMSYTNILDMLSLGKIPVLSNQRGEDDAIVVAGGPCAVNPEPLHMFIDAFMIGDGEQSIVELVEVLRKAKEEGKSRSEKLFLLSQIEGVYVPSLYEATYNEDGTLEALNPIRDKVPLKVQRRISKTFDQDYMPTCTPIPYMQVVHDRVVLEIMRGCTRGCRFCQAGMIYRPIRERTVERLTEAAIASVENSGYEEMSLSSLSSSDYSQIESLSERLSDSLKEQRVSISLPSLRVDKFIGSTLSDTQKVKKSSLTFAPEAGTQRLRDVINKGVTEEDLERSLSYAFENGWSAVKLYFMTGLPTETNEDLLGIAELAKTSASFYYRVPKGQRAKGLRINCSASVFVPKPFTPFQWCKQDEPELVKEKQKLVKTAFRELRSAHFSYHDSAVSQMEACFAVGDRKLSEVLYKAWLSGCILDGWSEYFNYELWLKAFEDCGLDVAFYAHRERGKDECLPWDHIDTGITKSFLWREYQKGCKAQITKDCRLGCNGCGLHLRKGVCPICG